ncbi:MAG: transglutaminase-like cysteine peptidase [Hyphomicrobiaceae bacterium]|nr:transglutaminase-like cysteine peptidase [Hyphomicrobiaceae bacterium]
MKREILGVTVLVMSLTAANSAEADISPKTIGQDASSPFMRVFGRSLPPIGHVGFCEDFPSECTPDRKKSRKVELTWKRKTELRDINKLVNRMVKPVSDMSLYGRIEHWTYPEGKGDCEDYVLLKQRMLIEHGWPAGALLITVVRDENNEGHAVLTVRTSQGDFLLDNKRSDIRTWNDSPYTFIKRQSARDPRVWVSLTKPGKRRWRSTAGTGTNN